MPQGRFSLADIDQPATGGTRQFSLADIEAAPPRPAPIMVDRQFTRRARHAASYEVATPLAVAGAILAKSSVSPPAWRARSRLPVVRRRCRGIAGCGQGGWPGDAARRCGQVERSRRNNIEDLTGAVRRGGVQPAGDTVSDDNPIWVEFARSMVPMMVPAAHAIADLIDASAAASMKVLDIAASHGVFGITIAQRNPRADIVAVDGQAVLAVAEENARAANVNDRFRARPGDAFEVDFGRGYDVALVTNFLHHFDAATCTNFLRKIHDALKPGGRVVILEMVPNPDRVSPPVPARFALTMLAGTAAGDAYTFDEYREQLEAAGFRGVSAHAIPTPETVLLATR